MLKKNQNKTPLEKVDIEGAAGTDIQWLLSVDDSTTVATMRRFVMEPGGNIPEHKHPWEHMIYVLNGKGTITSGGRHVAVEAEELFFIPENETHGYSVIEEAESDFIFLCIIPNKGDNRYYHSEEQLKRDGIPLCKECYFNMETGGCTLAYAIMLQPEETFLAPSGRVLGCVHGEEKDAEEKNKKPG